MHGRPSASEADKDSESGRKKCLGVRERKIRAKLLFLDAVEGDGAQRECVEELASERENDKNDGNQREKKPNEKEMA